MQITVKTLNNRVLSLDVESNDTIESVKNQIFNKDGVPISEQRLIFAGKEMENDKTLLDYNIQKDSTLHFLFKLRG
ncbi:predicted protein [Naegleria gruberi]|uniref:Predicted protein n=1 Tax=Naegleria gruberi TaxID=5762 RepID=D2UXA4_NAEGR|nr:uncharacterized protein NAEGRDRAFT_29181 [Naegleria gruberi]EFC50891.1 predicted protein [Naegleria gruberi]|eukprot:XP_002683635.1 predicted protein [Naegleria gruberi strain NEG-M]